MKKTNYPVLLTVAIFAFVSCNNLDFKRTKSGLLYKIIPSGNTKDSLAKAGDVIKFNVTSKLNDSVLYSSYGKMPGFSKVPAVGLAQANYSPVEVFSMLRKGDSAIIVAVADTFIKKGQAQELPPGTKKGDRFTTTFKIIEIFRVDSIARKDYNAEMLKDAPRRQKEMEEQNAKAAKEKKEQMDKEEADLRNSGEIDKEIKEIEAYLSAKKIKAEKTGKGVFVFIKKQGDGPLPDSGNVLTVKYTGRKLTTDSVFQSNSYTFTLGIGQVMQGWDEGLRLFKKGGEGTIYIPGFLAYGKNPPPNSPFKSLEPLIFDVEVTDLKDSTAAQTPQH